MFFAHQHIQLLLCSNWCQAAQAGHPSPDGSDASGLQGEQGATELAEGIAEA